MNKEQTILTYSRYMTYHVGCPGILGLVGCVFAFFPGEICKTIATIMFGMALALYFFGKARKKEKRDEFTTEIIHKSGTVALVSIAIASMVLVFIQGGTYIAKYSAIVNPFEFMANTAMTLLCIYISALGISFKYLESRC